MKILLILLGSLGIMAQTATFNGIGLTAPPPPAVSGISATRIGNAGNSTFYYWVVAKYTGGNSNPSPATIVQGAPNVLTVSNYIRLNWNAQANATGYDVLRTNDPRVPSGNCNCAVVTNTTATTVDDIGGVLSAYTIASASGVYTNCYLNNITVASPTVTCGPIAWGGGGGTYTDGDGITIVGNEISLDTGYTNTLYPLMVGGLVPTNKLGTGTADATTFLRGDRTYAAVSAPAFDRYGTIGGSTVSTGTAFIGAGANTSSATEALRQWYTPTACLARKLYIVTGSVQPGDGSLVVTLRNGSTDTLLAITIPAGSAAGTFVDSIDTVPLALGALTAIRVVNNSASPSAQIRTFGFICEY